MSELTKRQQNIIRRMYQGEEYYSDIAPRMTYKEYEVLVGLGFGLQSESPMHEGAFYYAMDKKQVKEKAAEYGLDLG